MSETPIATADPIGTNPAAIDVRLENFEGPLDLLLYLIKKNDLDIYDIPIAQITQEYLSYLDLMKELDLEMAGEFLVMASTLMQVKAQMLLPSPESEQEEGPDPRTELMNKLLEYQRFKEAANHLATQHEKAKDVYYRHVPPVFDEEDLVLKSSIFDLMAAFKRVLDAAPKEVGQVLRDEIPIEVKIREIMDRLVEHASVAFEELFHPESRRMERIVTFMALLELIRLKQVVARQPDIFGGIRIFRPDTAPAEPVAAAVDTADSVVPTSPEGDLHGTH